jgi:hypothetical protein
VVDRLGRLGEVFCIDVCAYAVMSNHHHVLVRLNPEQAAALSGEAVLLTCMSYVDLNLVLAAMADRPETSEHTSIQAHLREWTQAATSGLEDEARRQDAHASNHGETSPSPELLVPWP